MADERTRRNSQHPLASLASRPQTTRRATRRTRARMSTPSTRAPPPRVAARAAARASRSRRAPAASPRAARRRDDRLAPRRPSADAPETPPTPPSLPSRRRDVLALLALLAAPASAARGPPGALAAEDAPAPPAAVLAVGPGAAHATIASALAAAAAMRPPPSAPVVIRLAPGTYPERVVVDPDVAPAGLIIEPSSNASSTEARVGVGSGADDAVVVARRVSTPYESTIEIAPTPVPRSAPVTLRGLTIRHASPSVANNYAVFAREGTALRLERCDVSSDTGGGVAGEGADVAAVACAVHDCASNGVAVYGDLLGEVGAGLVVGCDVARCGKDGVLIRGGAVGVVEDCRVSEVGGFGVAFFEGAGEGSAARRNVVTGAGKKAAVGFKGVGTEENVVLEANEYR